MAEKRFFSSRILLKLSQMFVVSSRLIVAVSGDGVSPRAPGGEGAEAGSEGPAGRGSRHQQPPPTSDTRLCDPLGGGEIEVSSGLREVPQCLLKVPSSTFTIQNLLRHYSKQAFKQT